MSLSEIFDHGQVPPPWANIAVNNERVNGNLTVGGAQVQTVSGVLNGSTSTSPITVFSYPLPVPPSTNNGAFLFIFTLVAKGGPTGSTANAMSETTHSLVQITNGISSSNLNYFIQPSFLGTFTSGTVGQVISFGAGVVNFQVKNTNASQTTDFTWQVQIYPTIGAL